VLVTRHWTWSGENGTSSSTRSSFTSGPAVDVFVPSAFMGGALPRRLRSVPLTWRFEKQAGLDWQP
jgi:hypothetical protein